MKRDGRRRSERGSVTAELAVALPALVVLLAVVLIGTSAVVAKVQCIDAAREGARAAARGQSGEMAARRVAPAGARISIAVAGDVVRASVEADVGIPGGWLPSTTVSGMAVAEREPGESL